MVQLGTPQSYVGRLFDGAQTEVGSLKLGSASDAVIPVRLEQSAFRFFADNAAPATATALGTENTSLPIDIVSIGDHQFQLRVQIANSSIVAFTTPSLVLQRRYSGSPWEPVTDTSTGLRWGTSSFLATNDTVAASRLTAVGGMTFSAGFAVESPGSVVSPVSIATSRFTEVVWVVKVVWAEVSLDDLIHLRVICDGATSNMAFTQAPSISVYRSGVTARINSDWGPCTAQAAGVITRAVVEITGYQFFFEEAGKTPAGDQEALGAANATAPADDSIDINCNLRFQATNLDVRNDPSRWYLQYRENGGPWLPYVAWNSSLLVGVYDHGFWSHGLGLPEPKLPHHGPQVWTNYGKAVSTDNLNSETLGVGMYVEHCFSMRITGNLTTNGSLIEFRILRTGAVGTSVGAGDENLTYRYGYAKIKFFSNTLMPFWRVPTDVLATLTGLTTATVTWTTVEAASGYDIYRNDVLIAAGHPASPYIDTTLRYGVTYNYQVAAVG